MATRKSEQGGLTTSVEDEGMEEKRTTGGAQSQLPVDVQS